VYIAEAFIGDSPEPKNTGYQTEGDPHSDKDKIWVVPPGFVSQDTVSGYVEEIRRLQENLTDAQERINRYIEQVRALNNRMRSIRNITEYDEPAGKVPHAGA